MLYALCVNGVVLIIAYKRPRVCVRENLRLTRKVRVSSAPLLGSKQISIHAERQVND